MDKLIEQIPIMLRIGEIGSLAAILIGNWAFVSYFIVKAVNRRPGPWMIEWAISMMIHGTAFNLVFFVLEEVAKRIGII